MRSQDRIEPGTPERRQSASAVRPNQPGCVSVNTPTLLNKRSVRWSDGAWVEVLRARSSWERGPWASKSATPSSAASESAAATTVPSLRREIWSGGGKGDTGLGGAGSFVMGIDGAHVSSSRAGLASDYS
jgi:hypothetical protein